MMLTTLVSQQALASASGAILNPPKVPNELALNMARFSAKRSGVESVLAEVFAVDRSVSRKTILGQGPQRLLHLRNSEEFQKLRRVSGRLANYVALSPAEADKLRSVVNDALARLDGQSMPRWDGVAFVAAAATVADAILLLQQGVAAIDAPNAVRSLAAVATVSFVVGGCVQGVQVRLLREHWRKSRQDPDYLG
jgi:hypothetical protein